jgi:aminomethyltransferase
MKTPLHDRHCALGVKIISFAGWEMPVYYKGVIGEHQAVRQRVGLFDVSHMGCIQVRGKDAERFLDYLSTNQIQGKTEGSVIYTVWCHENGGSIDDLMIYKDNDTQFFLIVNAANRQKDLHHLLNYQHDFQVEIHDQFEDRGVLALQGPLAQSLLSLFYPEVKMIKPMHFIHVLDQARDLVISRTGYTGAGGFELYGNSDQIIYWWDQLLEKGKEFGIEPTGLGARDTLRLEMGFALYGHELNDQISPIESVAHWVVKWEKPHFLGKKALEELKNSFHKRQEYGIKLIDPGVAREGYPVLQEGKQIGVVTSGSFSPTLNQSIAIILSDVPLIEGDLIQVSIRQRPCQAEIVSLPFLRKQA